ncbi:hypothetical protein BJ956_002127 [Arthrobacter psychrochitiniphilus]|uniref:hypothetical protein n=1 Tax=Arthrobacter psychrochitiniphilus TaxID=291045 RepID=UPI00182D3C6C|nr:hypothetical protein [Arthrobacter psychrochitiniphilus]
MATNGHFCWPSVGSYVAAYGQFFMAANTAGSAGVGALATKSILSRHALGLGVPVHHHWSTFAQPQTLS